MTSHPFRVALLLAGAALSVAPAFRISAQAPVTAQTMVQPLSGGTDADRLGAVMRRVAQSPADVNALAEAGELSLRLGDASGAASLFARGERIDPQNGRIKAGMGAILVRAERPGEALRYFDQAEGYGWPPARYASDRGLAYDLLGHQDRAQRDYRLALAGGGDDETVRRYALSLGVSGRREQALEVLAPLVRRQDRGAWRARAFVMAMTGDAVGADGIAASMMPAAAAGLAPFFRRLPTLAPSDKAFAVHFGEVTGGAQRLADARLAPALAPLPAEADPFARAKQVAAATPAPAPVGGRDRSRRGERLRGGAAAGGASAEERSVARTGQAALASVSGDARMVPAAQVRPASAGGTGDGGTGAAAARPVALAARPPVPAAPRPGAPVGGIVAQAGAAPVGSSAALPGQAMASRGAVPMPAIDGGATVAAAPASSTPIPPAPAAAAPYGVQVAAAQAPLAPAASLPMASVPVAAVPTPPATDNDSILARIVAGITIPDAELAAAEARLPPALVAGGRRAARERADRAVAVNTIRSSRPAAGGADAVPARGRGAAASRPVALAEADVSAARRRGTARDVEGAGAPATGRSVGAGASGRRGTAVAAADEDAGERSVQSGRSTGPRGSGRRATDVAEAGAGAGAGDVAGRRGSRADIAPAGRAAGRRVSGRRTAEMAEAGNTIGRRDPDAGPARRVAGRRGTRDGAAEVAAADTPAARRGARGKAAARTETRAQRAAKAEPERIWVQVAGGANEGDLGKAWTAARKKSAALGGRSGYTTPSGATNRVVTGPFKTTAEARAFVNKLNGQGIKAFQVTSDAGQKVTRLPAK